MLINKFIMTITKYICCVQLFIEEGGEGIKIRPLGPNTINPSFLVTTSLFNTWHICPTLPSVSLSPSTPFPQQQCYLTLLAYLPYSSSHSPVPIILLTSSANCHWSLSNSPHITNKCSTSFPTPLPHITHHSSKIILHLLSSNVFFAKWYHFNVLMLLLCYFLHPVLPISHLNLSFQLPTDLCWSSHVLPKTSSSSHLPDSSILS